MGKWSVCLGQTVVGWTSSTTFVFLLIGPLNFSRVFLTSFASAPPGVAGTCRVAMFSPLSNQESFVVPFLILNLKLRQHHRLTDELP